MFAACLLTQALGLIGSTALHNPSGNSLQSSVVSHCASVGRRAALLALPFAFAAPKIANAADNFILLNPIDNEFLKLRTAQAQIEDLTRQFSAANHKYDDDDRTMVFQLLGFSFKVTCWFDSCRFLESRSRALSSVTKHFDSRDLAADCQIA